MGLRPTRIATWRSSLALLQYISAGTGIAHSEHNRSDETIRLLQVWIVPDRRGHEPAYGEYRFLWEERENRLLHMVSGFDGSAPVKINQDANLYSLSLDQARALEMAIGPGRQGYLVQIEILASERSHFLLVEMKKGGPAPS